MKIAVASNGNIVAEHFGHCQNFNIFVADSQSIISHESVSNPGHKPGFLPNFLHDLGVEVIISGGMGGGAVDIFNQHNIKVVVGASGDAKAIADSFVQGSLKSSGTICQQHEHEGQC